MEQEDSTISLVEQEAKKKKKTWYTHTHIVHTYTVVGRPKEWTEKEWTEPICSDPIHWNGMELVSTPSISSNALSLLSFSLSFRDPFLSE